MKSVGIDLGQWAEEGLFFHEAWRPTQFGIEMHLLRIHKLIEKVKPQVVIVDPITNLVSGSSDKEVYSMLMRLVDFLKMSGITGVFISLTGAEGQLESSSVGVSSLTDTWILLRDIELDGERNRCLYVLKSRGMAHSNQLREFVMTTEGIRLIPAYIGPGGVLTGSSRVAQEGREKAAAREQQNELRLKQTEINHKRLALQAQIASLQADIETVEQEAERLSRSEQERQEQSDSELINMAKSRSK
jgi:circadian clock protein KaiC